MKKFILLSNLIFIFTACTQQKPDYIPFVDPMIGSDYHGNVFVGASVPFGMVQLGPTNMSKGWHWCSGYHYSDSTIIGFSHTHLNGTGIGDLGDFLFMPSISTPTTFKGSFSDLTQGYVSLFSHNDEKVEPGYYSVLLKKHNIKVELTATSRVGYHRYTYPESSQSHVIIDLNEGIGWDETNETSVKVLDKNTITGHRFSNGWAKDQKIYFASKFSKEVDFKVITEKTFNKQKNDSIDVHKVIVNFSTKANEVVEIKTGISYVSAENALENLNSELPDWNFYETVKQAQKEWNAELSKVEIETDDENVKKMFYTSLFRTMISPSVFADINGDYRGADGEVYNTKEFVPHTIFSLWDTYRTFHSLQTILNPEETADWVNSLLDITEKQGKLPVWHLVGNETGTMVGVHSIPVIVDAVLKEIPGIDAEKAYSMVKEFSNYNENGLNYVREQGFIPADKENWSVSKALEYAIDDYAIALLAKKLGKEEDYQLFSKRAGYHSHYFDKETGFMRGKLSNGKWRENYNPFYSKHDEADYVEGNGWQYTWLVPHDVAGLINLFGGEDAFTDKLDSLFTVSSELNEEASIDISGLIGQYAHGNEPSHSTLYLYQYTKERFKTAERVREVLEKMYKPSPDGLCGNDDCGQMSAWYIMSAMGIYPMNPVNGEFVFGSPILDKSVITLPNGKKFTIEATNNSNENIYIESVFLNGKKHDKHHIVYDEIMAGGVLKINMTNKKIIN